MVRKRGPAYRTTGGITVRKILAQRSAMQTQQNESEDSSAGGKRKMNGACIHIIFEIIEITVNHCIMFGFDHSIFFSFISSTRQEKDERY